MPFIHVDTVMGAAVLLVNSLFNDTINKSFNEIMMKQCVTCLVWATTCLASLWNGLHVSLPSLLPNHPYRHSELENAQVCRLCLRSNCCGSSDRKSARRRRWVGGCEEGDDIVKNKRKCQSIRTKKTMETRKKMKEVKLEISTNLSPCHFLTATLNCTSPMTATSI